MRGDCYSKAKQRERTKKHYYKQLTQNLCVQFGCNDPAPNGVRCDHHAAVHNAYVKSYNARRKS